VYARFKNFYISRWPNEEQPAAQDDNDGPHVDLLYADFDLRLAELRAGRQYLTLGQGITYANVHDGIKLSAENPNWELSSFFAKTLPREENIDYSIPGFDKKSERYFTGVQAAWLPKEIFRFFGYFLSQQDRSDPEPINGQDFAYHSQYWGAGASVSDLRGFSSWAEYILESGSSAVFASEDRNGILAQAANVGANYRCPWLTHPDVTVEWAFGSGDKDRTNVTNTEGGNLRGKDRNFLPFGIYPAGYALAPALSNLHVLRIGGSAHPLEHFWQLKDLGIAADGYFYWKDKPLGGIYDVDAVEAGERTIGQEFNANIFWRIVSDVSISVRYGMFFPGDAYPPGANDSEIYISTIFTFLI
jgi:hypothetical protein